MRHKAKFNKNHCLDCKFARYMNGSYPAIVNGHKVPVCCSYGTITGNTCLTVVEHGKVIDRRGKNYNKCQLFVKGDNGILSEARRKKLI